MSAIRHRIGIRHAEPQAVYDALTTIDGLAAWWAVDTSGDPGLDGVIAFRFSTGGFDMLVRELVPAKSVRWEVVDGPEEWIGTEVSFDLRREDGYTIVLFEHRGWGDPVEFMYHCSTKWATFLLSLKDLLETGAGRPDPHDLRISNWH